MDQSTEQKAWYIILSGVLSGDVYKTSGRSGQVVGKKPTMLDFRSLLIGEIAGGLAEKAQGVSNSQFYIIICEACKMLKVSRPTLTEWNEFMDFLEWYEKIQTNAQSVQ